MFDDILVRIMLYFALKTQKKGEKRKNLNLSLFKQLSNFKNIFICKVEEWLK